MGITRIQSFPFLFHSEEKNIYQSFEYTHINESTWREKKMNTKEAEAEHAAHCSSSGNQKMIPQIYLTSSATGLMFHIIISEIAGAHLSTFRRKGACWRSSVGRVHPRSSGAVRIRMLVPSQPHLRAAAVGLRLHLPAGDQVGLQAWGDRNRREGSVITGRSDEAEAGLSWV